MNAVVLDWNAFMKGEVIPKQQPKRVNATPVLAITPMAENSSWQHIFQTAMTISDYLCMGIIIFAGGKWMFGDRTKSLELLIGCAIGYEIIRHAPQIQGWLANL